MRQEKAYNRQTSKDQTANAIVHSSDDSSNDTIIYYYRKHAFQLYNIHHLPSPIHSTHAIMYENLPSGLAVANDMQTVVELQEEEMRKCSEKDPACLLQRAMNGL